jgi:hypothetical protein
LAQHFQQAAFTEGERSGSQMLPARQRMNCAAVTGSISLRSFPTVRR